MFETANEIFFWKEKLKKEFDYEFCIFKKDFC